MLTRQCGFRNPFAKAWQTLPQVVPLIWMKHWRSHFRRNELPLQGVSRILEKSFKITRARQQASAQAAFKIFKTDPFDPRLRSHRINSLSAFYSKTVYAAEIEGDLRVAFYVEGNVIFTVDI